MVFELTKAIPREEKEQLRGLSQSMKGPLGRGALRSSVFTSELFPSPTPGPTAVATKTTKFALYLRRRRLYVRSKG